MQAYQTADCLKRVVPVFQASVRRLCVKPYPGHPKGCPNFGKRTSCPPEAPLLPGVFKLSAPVYCVWNAFDLARHVERMLARHPDWSLRQLRCCLYWQNTARKALRGKVKSVLEDLPDYEGLYCPEAYGVNVTATMADIGIELEWPPIQVAYQVALAGKPVG